jgi:Domain of unknown function (DUF5122) beta-propeller
MTGRASTGRGPGSSRPRRLLSGLFALAVAAGATLVSAGPAVALAQLPDQTWKVRGKVFALTEGQSGGVSYLYVGGKFSRVREQDGSHPFHASSVARLTLDGTGDPSFAPVVSKDAAGTEPATVLTVALSADGSVLYLGGKFAYVNGVAHKDLAAVSTVDGSLIPGFDATPSNNVNSILVERGGTRLFVGGSFKTMNGETARRLAAIDAASGALDPLWAPAADSTVRKLLYSSSGGTIFVTGHFTTIADQPRQSVARLDLDGSLNGWQAQAGVIPTPMTCWDAGATADALYLGCGAGPNFAAAFSVASGAKIWKKGTPGNVESVALSPDGANVFLGGHFGTNHKTKSICSDTMSLHGLAEVAAGSGAFQCWAPHLYPDSGNAKGAWTLLVDSQGRLWTGGWFTQICFPDDSVPENCVPQQSLAGYTI